MLDGRNLPTTKRQIILKKVITKQYFGTHVIKTGKQKIV